MRTAAIKYEKFWICFVFYYKLSNEIYSKNICIIISLYSIGIQAIYHIRIENYAEGLRTPLSQLEISRLDYIVHCKKIYRTK